MFLAAVSSTLLALALLVLAKPLKAKMFPNRKEARRVRLVVERGRPYAVMVPKTNAVPLGGRKKKIERHVARLPEGAFS